MATFNVRLRHPKGATVLQLTPEMTYEELQLMIFSASDIPIAEQELKLGYPPKPIPSSTLAETQVSTIPITKGEQVIVSAVPSTSTSASRGVNNAASQDTKPTSLNAAPQPRSQSQPKPPVSAPTKSTVNTLSNSSSTSASTPVAPAGKETTVDLPGGAGIMQHRIVPDDNSCLFSSIGVVFKGGYSESVTNQLRQIVADEIRKDEFEYPEVVLGRPRDEYVRTILKPSTWGGAIELAIFAKHFKTEIDSFDVLSGRADKFGEGQYDSRCLLVYSGIHYDAITTSPVPDAPADFHTTLFPVTDDSILPGAQKLVDQLKKQHYYTDTANFDLRCQVCKVGLKGETGARQHAMQ
ncbi:hypothetical protein FFLO_01381 [Filobasidium floriforme]|uniref:Ubiquitin thioesterase OTU n=1 Tax=Filobasidium floriforme TaxID=5210 RepID=A0A8K0JQ41_9TREE|nr:hypothetical protein FFLO_01381 [Filobasidium floriforme]